MIYKFNREYINTMAKKNPMEFVFDSERLVSHQIQKAVNCIDENKQRKVISIAGPSSSGKTTFATRLSEQLIKSGYNPIIISIDNYFLDRESITKDESGDYNFETVDVIDTELLAQNFLDISLGKTVHLPVYNFSLGRRTEEVDTVMPTPNSVILMEGLHAFNSKILGKIAQLEPVKVYISVKEGCRERTDSIEFLLSEYDIRFLRRMVRDYQYRSSSPINTLEMWDNVLKGEKQYIDPFKVDVDVYVNSLYLYEPCVIKKFAIPLLEIARTDERYREYADRLLGVLDGFFDVDERFIPHDSIFREFIG